MPVKIGITVGGVLINSIAVLFSLLISIFVVCALPAMLPGTVKLHRSFNLYNGGLATGLLGLFIYAFMFNTMGVHKRDPLVYENVHYAANDHSYLLFCSAMCTATLTMHGGFVLYNGGLIAGISALILLPLLDTYLTHVENGDRAATDTRYSQDLVGRGPFFHACRASFGPKEIQKDLDISKEASAPSGDHPYTPPGRLYMKNVTRPLYQRKRYMAATLKKRKQRRYSKEKRTCAAWKQVPDDLFLPVKQRAAGLSEIGNPISDVLRADLEMPGQTAHAMERRSSAVDELARHGDLIPGQHCAAGLAGLAG